MSLYLLREREFIRLDENIYKFGCTINLQNRMSQYPKSSELIMVWTTLKIDCINFEKEILIELRKNFIARKDIGSEYFEGNILEIIVFINKLWLDNIMFNTDTNQSNQTKYLKKIDLKTLLWKDKRDELRRHFLLNYINHDKYNDERLSNLFQLYESDANILENIYYEEINDETYIIEKQKSQLDCDFNYLNLLSKFRLIKKICKILDLDNTRHDKYWKNTDFEKMSYEIDKLSDEINILFDYKTNKRNKIIIKRSLLLINNVFAKWSGSAIDEIKVFDYDKRIYVIDYFISGKNVSDLLKIKRIVKTIDFDINAIKNINEKDAIVLEKKIIINDLEKMELFKYKLINLYLQKNSNISSDDLNKLFNIGIHNSEWINNILLELGYNQNNKITLQQKNKIIIINKVKEILGIKNMQDTGKIFTYSDRSSIIDKIKIIRDEIISNLKLRQRAKDMDKFDWTACVTLINQTLNDWSGMNFRRFGRIQSGSKENRIDISDYKIYGFSFAKYLVCEGVMRLESDDFIL